MNDLKIFKLGLAFAEVLQGDKEAIADIKKLYDNHPEMFENIEDLINVIQEVALEPKIIVNAKRDGAYLGAKVLDKKKMGEIAIENDSGTNVIFHANKKREKEFYKIEKQLQVETPTPSTHRDLPTGELVNDKNQLPGKNLHSVVTDENIIPKSDKNSNEIEEVNLLKESFDEKIKELKNNFNDIWNDEKNKTNKNSNTRKQNG